MNRKWNDSNERLLPTMMHQNDTAYMEMALERARLGSGQVSPNPMVGAVIVRDDAIVGSGYYLYSQVKHAERCALDEAGHLARGATLYCTLEPCCHQGRTPPCSEAVIDAGVARVVTPLTDPNPRVNGAGLRQLRDGGVAVDSGPCTAEARRLNEIYLKWASTGTPFLHGVSYRSGARAGRRIVQLARHYDAVLIGQNVAIELPPIALGAARLRHRPLVVAGSEESVGVLRTPRGAAGDSLVVEVTARWEDAGEEILKRLAMHSVTGVLVLAGSLSSPDSWVSRNIDKLTVLENVHNEERSGHGPVVGTLFQITEKWIDYDSDLFEITCYPRDGQS